MSDFASAFDEAEVKERRDYLGQGKHTVTVQSLELKTGDDARPKWANKSLSVMLGNDEGVTYLDIELDPLTFQDGELNKVALGIAKTNLTHLGCSFNKPKTVSDFSQQAEAFFMSGAARGAEVDINITEKDSGTENPNTPGKNYINRNVYVNKLITAGQGDAMTASIPEPAVI